MDRIESNIEINFKKKLGKWKSYLFPHFHPQKLKSNKIILELMKMEEYRKVDRQTQNWIQSVEGRSHGQVRRYGGKCASRRERKSTIYYKSSYFLSSECMRKAECLQGSGEGEREGRSARQLKHPNKQEIKPNPGDSGGESQEWGGLSQSEGKEWEEMKWKQCGAQCCPVWQPQHSSVGSTLICFKLLIFFFFAASADDCEEAAESQCCTSSNATSI